MAPNEDPQKSQLVISVLSGALGLATATGLLYLCGFAAQVGFMRVFGISANMFPETLQLTLTRGFTIISSLGLKALYPLSVAFVVILIVNGIIFLTIKLVARRRVLHRPPISEGRRGWDKLMSDLPWAETLMKVFLVPFSLILICSSVLVGMNLAGKEGEAVGRATMAALDGDPRAIREVGQPPQRTTLTYAEDDHSEAIVLTGHLVESSADFIAFYADRRVIIIPMERVIMMVPGIERSAY